jgi:autotransporter-associated beta strand protein
VTNNNGSGGPGADGGSGGNGGAAQGGAVYVASGGTLTILDTAISGSAVTGGSGGSQGVGQGPNNFNGSPGSTGVGSGAGIFLAGVNATIGVSSGTVTYSDGIAGTGFNNTALTKTGAGTLILSATNSFVGNIAVNGGTLQVASTTNLGALGNDILINNGTLAVTATATLASGRAFLLSGVSGIDIASGTTTTLQGTVSGSGLLDKTIRAPWSSPGRTPIPAGPPSMPASCSSEPARRSRPLC